MRRRRGGSRAAGTAGTAGAAGTRAAVLGEGAGWEREGPLGPLGAGSARRSATLLLARARALTRVGAPLSPAAGAGASAVRGGAASKHGGALPLSASGGPWDPPAARR